MKHAMTYVPVSYTPVRTVIICVQEIYLTIILMQYIRTHTSGKQNTESFYN